MWRARQVALWSAVHRWSSVICTIFLFVLCLTGLPLIFHDEIDALTEGRPPPPAIDAGAAPASLDRIVEAGRHRHPAEYPQYVFWPPDAPGFVHLGLAPSRNPEPEQIHRLVIDAHTAQVASEPKPARGTMQVVLKLHSELLAGLPGTLFLGAMGLAFIISVVSGTVLYAPFMRRLTFGTVRFEKAPRLAWLDLHNLLAIVALAWTAVVGMTGVVNTLEKPLFALWRVQALPLLLAPYAGKPQPETLASVEDAVAVARKATPGMQVTSVLFPYSRFNSPRHYLIWAKGRTALTAHLFTAVLVDAETGTLSASLDLPWYLRALELSRPLHFGDYGGLPLKIIWALLDLVTMIELGSGVYLFVTRGRLSSAAPIATPGLSSRPLA